MGKRTVEKASCEKGPFADAQSLKQSSLRCGTRFVGAAEESPARSRIQPLRQRPVAQTVLAALRNSLCGRRRRGLVGSHEASCRTFASPLCSFSRFRGWAAARASSLLLRRQAMLLQRLARSLPPLKTLPQPSTFRLLIWTIRSATWMQATMRGPPRASLFRGRPQVLTARVPQSMVRR